MSYDLRIWSGRPADLSNILPDAEGWTKTQCGIVREENEWSAEISESVAVEEEDIPEQVVNLLPGIAFLTDVGIHPIDAPKTAIKHVVAIAKKIAKATHGVIENQHESTFTLPSGIKRFISTRDKGQTNGLALELTWFFVGKSESEEDTVRALLTYLAAHLPEALPRRYGLNEPPPYKYAEGGIDEFIRHYFKRETFVWYPTKPLRHAFYGFQALPRPNDVPRKFCAGMLKMEFDPSVLDQPGWRIQLERVFTGVAKILRPFFADVRIVEKWVGTGDQRAHPIVGPWWNGLPDSFGLATIIGEPYLALWPQARSFGKDLEGMRFSSEPEWKQEASVDTSLTPPADMRRDNKDFFGYVVPPVFPFPTNAKRTS